MKIGNLNTGGVLITSLTMGNFQGFGPKTKVPLSNVSLIFGPNSSGKSSVFRALRLIAQSLNQQESFFNPSKIFVSGESSPTKSAKFLFSGELVDLGSFDNAINGQDSRKSMTLGVQLSESTSAIQIVGIDWQIGHDETPFAITLKGRYAVDDEKSDIRTFTLELQRTNSEESFMLTEESQKTYSRIHRHLSKLTKTLDEAAKQEQKVLPLLKGLFRASHKPGIVAELDLDDSPVTAAKWKERLRSKALRSHEVRFTADRFVPAEINEELSSHVALLAPSLQSALDRFHSRLTDSLRNLHYVGPLRPVPDKLIGSFGYTSEEEASTANDLSLNPALRDSVSKYLKALTSGIYELEWWPVQQDKTQAFKHLPHLGALLIHDTNNDTRVTFSDVGVGLSQLLPILAKLVVLEQASTPRYQSPGYANGVFLAEQPELHLHPKMQSELAEFFSRVATKKKNPVQIIAETHSESMLLRLQNLIRNKKIESSTVQVLYTQRIKSTHKNSIKPLPLNPAGDFIEKWPQSFSELRIDEFF